MQYKTKSGKQPYKSCFGSNLPDNWIDTVLTKPPVDKLVQSCAYERVIIEEQKVKIGRLEALLQSIINFFKLK